MNDDVLLFMFVGVFFLGMLSTIAYWFLRYCFNTDQEQAEIKAPSRGELTPDSKPSTPEGSCK